MNRSLLVLAQAPPTRARRLRIRTYKVVPLSPAAGVLEWVDGTIGLNAYLNEKPYLSTTRYARPGSMTVFEARRALDRAHDTYKADARRPGSGAGGPGYADPRWAAALDVFARTSPTFHHFFTDLYASPDVWLARRAAYTRSVAASSMAAYVAGIGDRHASNQLVDTESGEVVMSEAGGRGGGGCRVHARPSFVAWRALPCAP